MRNNEVEIIMNWEWFAARATGIGSRRTISTSNIRKITARRKNRREKGIRADLFGSNPHSKGDVFSRSLIARALRVQARQNTKIVNVIAMEAKSMVWIISLRH